MSLMSYEYDELSIDDIIQIVPRKPRFLVPNRANINIIFASSCSHHACSGHIYPHDDA